MRKPGASARRVGAILAFLALPLVAADGPKIVMFSHGDYLENRSELSSQQAIENTFRGLRDAGFTTVHWRMLS